MLSVSNTLGNSGASLSLETRVAVGAGVFAVGAAETSAPEPEARVVAPPPPVSTPAQKNFAYNAFEFAYRSDFGKIILLQQNVETGQELTQVPTEYHLRQYAATQRQQRVELQQKLYKGSAAETQSAPQTVVATTTERPAVSTSAPSASPPASPSVAPAAVAAASAAHVDITT